MNTKKILVSLIAAAAVACTIGITASAEADAWDGTADTTWYTEAEEGTAEFEIDTAEELAGLATLVNEGNTFSGKTITLAESLDLAGYNWTPIGTKDKPFSGVFDGGKGENIVISNLFIENTNPEANKNYGLFGTIYRATLQNVYLDNVDITVTGKTGHNYYTGGLVGFANSYPEVKESTKVINSTVTGNLTVSGRGCGGIVGYAYATTKLDGLTFGDAASERSSLSIDDAKNDLAYGGIVGYTYYVKTFNNLHMVNAEINGTTLTAGLIGWYNNDGASCDITNCSVEGSEINGANGTGGIVGLYNSPVSISSTTVKNTEINGVAQKSGVFVGFYDDSSVDPNDVIIEETCESTNNTGTASVTTGVGVAEINGTKYATLKKAIEEAEEGDIIYVYGIVSEGTIKLPATITNLTIDGQNTAVVKNTVITAADGNSINYNGITIKNTTFDNSRFVLGGQRSGDVIYKDITFDNNKFLNIVDANSMAAIHMNIASEENEYVENFTFINNVIDGVTGSNNSGVLIKNAKGDVVFNNNTITNVAFNAIQCINVKSDINLKITNNKLESDGNELNLFTVVVAEINNNTTPDGDPIDVGNFKLAASVGDMTYSSISAAIDAVDEGTVIVILPGTHNEALSVTKSVVLTGNPNYGADAALAADDEIVKPVINISDVTNGGVKYEAANITFDNLVFNVLADATGETWNVSALGYYYENVKDREGLTVTNCDFINNSDISMSAIAANLATYTITNNTFKNFETIVHSFVDHGALGTVVVSDNTFENVKNIVNAYWGAENTEATLTITNNTATDDSTAKIIVDDFGKTKATPVTAIPTATITDNDAKLTFHNLDSSNKVTGNTDITYMYRTEAIMRALDGKLPDGVVYVERYINTDGDEVRYETPVMFLVVDGYVKTEAESVELVFVPNTTYDAEALENSVWDLVLIASDAEIINRLNSADFTFELTTDEEADAMAYEIIATNDEVAINNVNNDENRYEFHYEDKDADVDTDTALRITLGTVKFTGYGAFTFTVDTTDVAENTNQAHATTFVDNIVDSYTVAAGTLTVNNAAENEDGDTDFGTIDSEIIVPTKALTINIDFPNSVSDNAVAYQQMKVTVSGGELEAPLTIDLGTDYVVSDLTVYDNKKDIAVTVSANNPYEIVITNLLEVNTAYNVEVSGVGYRTAKYTVTMTDNKTLNFWNNVKDNAVEVEEDKASSAKNVTFLAGDIVKDSTINIYDLSAVVSYFGEVDLTVAAEGYKYAKYDLNRDGKIDSKDVAYVLVSWGK